MKFAVFPERSSLAGLCLSLALLAACSKSAPVEPPPTVTVGRPLVRQVTDWDDYAGRFEAVDSVEVRPRVSGLLQVGAFPRWREREERAAALRHRSAALRRAAGAIRAQLARAQAAQVNAEPATSAASRSSRRM